MRCPALTSLRGQFSAPRRSGVSTLPGCIGYIGSQLDGRLETPVPGFRNANSVMRSPPEVRSEEWREAEAAWVRQAMCGATRNDQKKDNELS